MRQTPFSPIFPHFPPFSYNRPRKANDPRRIRYQAMSVTPLDYKTEANKLVELIKQMSV